MSLIDKEYGRVPLPKGVSVNDGHRLFLLPGYRKVVIEKMYEKDKNGIHNCNNKATFVMDIEEFWANIENIIKQGSINRTAVGEIVRAGKVDRIIHSANWGKSVMKYFGIDEQNERYSAEDLEEIKLAAESVKESRREKEETR